MNEGVRAMNFRIYDLLHEGAENPTTARDLAALLGVKSRDVTRAIEKERAAGYPICASTGINPGYYIPTDRETMEAYCLRLWQRERNIARTRRACVESARHLPPRLAPTKTDDPITHERGPAHG